MSQPARLTIGQQISRLTPEFDALLRDAEARDADLGRFGQLQLHELEERARALAEALVAPFRKPSMERAVNPPLFMERRADGSCKAGW